jgi:hypothetical protein
MPAILRRCTGVAYLSRGSRIHRHLQHRCKCELTTSASPLQRHLPPVEESRPKAFLHEFAFVFCSLSGESSSRSPRSATTSPISQTTTAANKIPRQKGCTIDAWIMIFAIAAFGVVIGKLLYELNPSLWKGAAASAEDDAPADGAIDDYLEWADDQEDGAAI